MGSRSSERFRIRLFAAVACVSRPRPGLPPWLCFRSVPFRNVPFRSVPVGPAARASFPSHTNHVQYVFS
eukprot:883419-Prymnesium_polylepis.2